jgi:hypothetical protein
MHNNYDIYKTTVRTSELGGVMGTYINESHRSMPVILRPVLVKIN